VGRDCGAPGADLDYLAHVRAGLIYRVRVNSLLTNTGYCVVKCIECTCSVPESGSRVKSAVFIRRNSDGDRERNCPPFYPRILT
jgi:hypothetical protein